MNYDPILKFSAKIKVANDDGSIEFRLTERAVDRYGEVVMPKGVVLDNFKLNPAVLWAHNMDRAQPKVNIGIIEIDSFDITADHLDAKVRFDENGKDPFAEMVADKVRNGFLSAGSIGFRPIEISEEFELEGQTGVTYKKWELLEFSVVPIGALPSSLAKREFIEFAEKCKEMGHPLENIIDQFYRQGSPIIKAKPKAIIVNNFDKLEIDMTSKKSIEEAVDALGGILKNFEPDSTVNGNGSDEESEKKTVEVGADAALRELVDQINLISLKYDIQKIGV